MTIDYCDHGVPKDEICSKCTEEFWTPESGDTVVTAKTCYVPEDVVLSTLDSLSGIFKYGATKYKPDSWRDEYPLSHLLKALTHLSKGIRNMILKEEMDEPHFECALWRIAIALTLRSQGMMFQTNQDPGPPPDQR